MSERDPRRARPNLRRLIRALPWLAASFGLAAVAAAAPKAAAGPRQHTGKSARIPTGYAEMVRRWHIPPPVPPALTLSGRPALVLELLNTSERVELTPQSDTGG